MPRMMLASPLGWHVASHSTNGQLQGLNSSDAIASHSDVAAAAGGVARLG